MNLLHRAEKKGQRFQNPVPTEMAGFSTMIKVAPRIIAGQADAAPKHLLGPFHTDASLYATPPASGLRVTWFGHACSLLEIDGVRVLIDPVWEQRASPVQWGGPKRFFGPTLPLEELPTIDAVLVSHDHYDHLGAETIKRLSTLQATAKAQFVCALGVGKRLRKFGVAADRISELDWTQSATVAGSGEDMGLATKLTITAWPSRHFSGRGLFDRFTTLWGSYVLEGPKHRVFFDGDSGYWDGYKEIASRYERFDLCMLPIGASDPLWHVIHMNPVEAVQAYRDLGGAGKAGLLMPIHWGLFNLALHGWRDPIEQVTRLAGGGDVALFSPQPGQPTEVVEGRDVRSGWWQARA